jgi:dihydrofolate reductase
VRRIRYWVAASLDGLIASPNEEAYWTIMDREIDFRTCFDQFDAILLGRPAFEAMAREGRTGFPGMKTCFFSKSLRASDP